ncbi:nucleotidyl transferase AbiEii/AbiGii toxin family protein [Streptomyces netropsis]
MTATPWERFSYGPWDDTAVVPQLPPGEATRADRDFPHTLLPVPGHGVLQRPTYDPAANHHAMGMRLSEPQFTDAHTGRAWGAARRHALDHVLAAVAASPWAEHLVLRGSVLLKAWFGEAAREPGDLDFVVVPDTWRLADDRTDAMLDGIARGAEELAREAGGLVRIDAAGAVSDEIWTYDRVPGRRLVLPWTAAEGTPPGTVQLDFVFNETLPAPAVRTTVPRRGPGAPAVLMAASPELSLAWKILWLVTDRHPEAKDLYDAVLLAESTRLPYALVQRVLVAAGEYPEGSPLFLSHILHQAAEADWFEFRKDHPDFPDDEATFLTRFAVALAPAFAPAEHGVYAQLAASFQYLTQALSEQREAGGMEAVEEWLAGRGVHSVEAVVAVRELLGRTRCTLGEAADVLASFRDTRFDHDKHLYRGGWRGDAHRVAGQLEAADARTRSV